LANIEVSISTKQLLEKLEEWQQEHRLSSSFLESYKELLAVQAWAEEQIGDIPAGISGDDAHKRLASGVPLLGYDELRLDWTLVADIFRRVTEVSTGYPELWAGAPLPQGKKPVLTPEVVKAWLTGGKLPLVNGDSFPEHLLGAVLHTTLKPFLAKQAKALLGLVDQESWRRSYCPVCGGSPDFAFLEQEEGARWLVCSRCDSQWLYQRLKCPYCDNSDHGTLSYLSSGKDPYRLYICRKCQSYLKAIDLRQAGGRVFLPLERLLTLDLDRQGQELGYHAGRLRVRGYIIRY
jgi:hypothetical protein